MSKEVIGIIAGVISFTFYLFYIISILKKETRPSKSSWWIFSFSGLVLVVSYYYAGARATIWLPAGEALGFIIIALLSLKYGESSSPILDWICLLGAVIGIFVWIFSGSPLLALVALIIVDFIGLLPTFWKLHKKPEDESHIAWFFSFLGAFISIFSIENWTFGVAVYPIYTTFISFMVLITFFSVSEFKVKKRF